MKCCYPNCYLEDEHEGDHRFGRPEKPWGEIRIVQRFNPAMTWDIPCDLEPGLFKHGVSVVMAVDMLGFGWSLCASCLRVLTAEGAKVTEKPQPKPAPPPEVGGFTVSNVVVFDPTRKPRAKSQRLKAGVP